MGPVRKQVFESVEKATMLPGPCARFDVPVYIEKAKVHPDHHIQVARAHYSVPNPYLRKHDRMRADRTAVKIYFGTALIKTHSRKSQGRTLDRSRRLLCREGDIRATRHRRAA